jgi:hypothetical protein
MLSPMPGTFMAEIAPADSQRKVKDEEGIH